MVNSGHTGLREIAQDVASLTRSAAVLHALGRLGGLWRLIGWAGRLVPAFLRDAVARLRHRLFGRPEGAFPLLPAGLRARFIAG